MKELRIINAIRNALLILLIGTSVVGFAQEDLMDLFEDEKPHAEYVAATFKTTRVINGHSIESVAPGELLFTIQHRFGQVNSGAYELFGLDQSTIRLGFEFGITNRLNLGFGRSSYNKTYDAFFKYKLLRQGGEYKIPVTVSWYSAMVINSMKWQDLERDNLFTSRMSFTHQVLIARKFTKKLSLQLSPSIVHQNLVEQTSDKNDLFVIGFGGRYKLTNRLSVNAEYFYIPDGQSSQINQNALSVGLDIETGGHVFQLHFSNAKAFFDPGFLIDTNGKWSDGDIFFGFNISRSFVLKE